MEDVIGAVLEGVIELFAASKSPYGFIVLVIVAAICGVIYYMY